MTTTDTKQKIMEVARGMVQARGYNALSFRDLAEQIGVKSASIHYHFPTKGDLGAALARRYTEDGAAYLKSLLETTEDQGVDLRRYTDIFRSALTNNNRMCLCGIMAAEYEDLPVEVRTEVDKFTELQVQWLSEILTIKYPGRDKDAIQRHALAIFAAIEGAQLIARGREDVTIFDTTIEAYRSAGLLP